jgi:hypothetical protein
MKLFCIVLLLTTFASSGDKFDSYWWAGMSPSFKLGYVSGYAQAMDFSGTVSLGGCLNFINYMDKTKYSADKWLQMCQNDKTYDFDGISMGQFVDGVDVFYKDFRNKNLEIGVALAYVRDQIKGKTPAGLEKELTDFRNAQASYAK